jgi:hypothetical protein
MLSVACSSCQNPSKLEGHIIQESNGNFSSGNTFGNSKKTVITRNYTFLFFFLLTQT